MASKVRGHPRRSKRGFLHRVRSFFRRGRSVRSDAKLRAEKEKLRRDYEEQERRIDAEVHEELLTREQAHQQKLVLRKLKKEQAEAAEIAYEERRSRDDERLQDAIRSEQETRLLKERIRTEKLQRESEKTRLDIERIRAQAARDEISLPAAPEPVGEVARGRPLPDARREE